MRVADFSFDLPEELIAKFPMEKRSASRLLTLDGNSGALSDCRFTELLNLVQPGDLMVFNNTRVIPARYLGRRQPAVSWKSWWSGCWMTSGCWLMCAAPSRRKKAVKFYSMAASRC